MLDDESLGRFHEQIASAVDVRDGDRWMDASELYFETSVQFVTVLS